MWYSTAGMCGLVLNYSSIFYLCGTVLQDCAELCGTVLQECVVVVPSQVVALMLASSPSLDLKNAC